MYLIAYDIVDNKRRRKIQKLVYSYAFGGQKSALECLINKKEAIEIAKKLSKIIDLEKDRCHIIKVEKFIYLRSAKEITFKNGDIIL
ncbi:CRISPR-associated endonuclease Cas2 [Caminibacter mediatlanticus TB-2]|uniref:CRISPR-associated endonuclease Cas2 n=1 Tax=Caminibacter mediatlanticus TB-2 TaxID=391592 RepID=A0ABX5VAQ6_9BACT|nr:CRISPR-associated endonuclease Cas2 [Caminibacter mediatlanticus]QCT93641.1 CRISPR-associated endonuclease Cas2 [Caminibacter mediatlanticus TB-2]